MSSDWINMAEWLLSEDDMGGPPGTGPGMPMNNPAPAGPPGGGMPPGQPPVMGQQPDPNIANQPADNQMPGEDDKDITNDPQHPDMPQDDDGGKGFEEWRKDYFKEAVTGDVAKLKSAVAEVRDRELDSYQRKFVEDNLQVLFLREHSNIDKASKEIRKLIKQQIDHNNPATTLVNYIHQVLGQQPLLNNIYLKLTGLYALKGDMHRKFLASLLGAVQVGSGGNNEDIVYNENEYSVRISTRFNSRFGEVHIGKWSLKQDDPERYLQPAELKRLEEGSPEEKDVLRRRVVMESIAETFRTRAFVINVVGTDGTVYHLGWDISTCLKSAYAEGRLVVRVKNNDAAEAMIDDDGRIVPYLDMTIMYLQDTDEQDEDGRPQKREVEFIVRREGQLFLSAQLPVLKDTAGSFQGMVLKESPWQGNPSDLRSLQRCVPNATDMLLRQC